MAAPSTIHADLYPSRLQAPCKDLGGELATLVAVEDLGSAIVQQCFLKCF